MLICDLCRKPVVLGEFRRFKGREICADCIKICKEIIRHPKFKDVKIVYLNEYKELKEQRRV